MTVLSAPNAPRLPRFTASHSVALAVVFALLLPVAYGAARLGTDSEASRKQLQEQIMNTHASRLDQLSRHAFAPLAPAALLPRPKPQRLRQRRVDALKLTAASIAQREGIPPHLFLALVFTESAFNPVARSRVGAIGLAQLMPDTARELGVDPHDPVQNLTGGARYLRQQYERFGSWQLALAAYNAGPGRVHRAGGVPNIRETRNYVDKIITLAALDV